MLTSRKVLWPLMLALATCSSPSGHEVSRIAAGLDVDVEVREGQLQVLGLSSGRSTMMADPDAPRLRYEARADDGVILASFEIADPRFVRSERVQDGRLSSEHVWADFGVQSIQVPESTETIVVSVPDKSGWRELGRATMPDTVTLTSALLRSGDAHSPVRIRGVGRHPLDILFLSEGYTDAELGRFSADVETVLAQLVGLPDYAPQADRIGALRADVRSRESGIDDPEASSRDTAFDISFGTSVRRCTWFTSQEAMAAVRDLKNQTGAQAVVVLLNEDESAGCAAGGIVVQSRGPNAGLMLGHELGHAFLSLSDEYGGSSTCARDAGLHGLNLSYSPLREVLPWGDLVNASMPLPTPAGRAGVGAFEGGGYCDANKWRPQEDCLMRTLGIPMCPVCRRELNRFFEKSRASVALLAPTPATILRGTVTLAAAPQMPEANVVAVEFYGNTTLLGTAAAPPFAVSLDTISLQDGAYLLSARVLDTAGNVGVSPGVSVMVFNQTSGDELLINGGFEGAVRPWTLAGSASQATAGARSGTGHLSLMNGSATQEFTLPSTNKDCALSFWLKIDSAETGATANDSLTLELRGTSGVLLATLGTYNNLGKGPEYVEKASFGLNRFRGKTVRLQLRAAGNASLPTTFRIDDVSVKVLGGSDRADSGVDGGPRDRSDGGVDGGRNGPGGGGGGGGGGGEGTGSGGGGGGGSGGRGDAGLDGSGGNGGSSDGGRGDAGLDAGSVEPRDGGSGGATDAGSGGGGAGGRSDAGSDGGGSGDGWRDGGIDGGGSNGARDGGLDGGSGGARDAGQGAGNGTEHVVNGGFESGSAPWTLLGAARPVIGAPAHSGQGHLALGGSNGSSGTASVEVVIPDTETSPKLSVWIQVDSQEAMSATPYDKLAIEVRSLSNALLGTLGTLSNSNDSADFRAKSFSLGAYKGQRVVLRFHATCDDSLPTTFRVDDVSVR
jgi:hypothetical protein